MRLLFVTTVLPGQSAGGGELVTRQVIDALRAAGATVRVIGYARPGDSPRGQEVTVIEERPIETAGAGAAAVGWMARGLARRQPYTMAKYASRAAVRALSREVLAGVDGIFVEPLQAPWHQLPPQARSLPLVYVALNVESELYRMLSTTSESRLRRLLNRREAIYVERSERELIGRATQTWTMTGEDRCALMQAAPQADVRALMVPSQLRPARGSIRRCDIAMIGSWTWHANSIGLHWFVEDVLPLLPSHLTIRIAGRGTEWLEGLRPTNVVIEGIVPDAAEFLAGAAVIAVPSRAGAGIQVKLLDAIATGRPVVATPIAARGLENPPSSVWIAADPQSFAAHLSRLAASSSMESDEDALAWSTARGTTFQASVAKWLADIPWPGAARA